MAVQTQWRYGGSFRTGLDYSGVAVVARSLDVDLRLPRTFDGLQLIESTALSHWSDRAMMEMES